MRIAVSCLLATLFSVQIAWAESVKVVATLPILKEFTEQVGGPHVDVTSLISGLESEHSYSPKPSDLKAIAQAKLLIEIGLGLEVWVQGLVKNAGNATLQIVTTSHNVPLIRGSDEDQHGSANPHIWLDPENAKIMLRHIADALVYVDPTHSTEYQRNLARYLQQLDEVQQDLQHRVSVLQNRRIIAYHPAWPYFAQRFGFSIEDDIIHQVGAEPTVAHMSQLVHRMKTQHIRVIVSEPQLNQKIVQTLAQATGARVVVLSPLPGAIPGTASYLDLLTYNVRTLVEALQSP